MEDTFLQPFYICNVGENTMFLQDCHVQNGCDRENSIEISEWNFKNAIINVGNPSSI